MTFTFAVSLHNCERQSKVSNHWGGGEEKGKAKKTMTSRLFLLSLSLFLSLFLPRTRQQRETG